MAADQPTEKPTESMTFEQAMTQLRAIVERVETGQVELEESITQYELGCKLIQHCRQKLADAEQRIELLSKDAGGRLVAEPLDADDADSDA